MSARKAASGIALVQASGISSSPSSIDGIATLPAPTTTTTTTGSARYKKGITTRLTYIPISPRLQALASPIGPCTPFTLEEHGMQSVSGLTAADYVTTPVSQDLLDKAFARTRSPSTAGAKRLYSSVLTAQR